MAPSARGRRYFCLRSSDPARISGVLPSLLAPGISEEEAHTRATSSTTMAEATASAPTPPYSSGTCGAWKSEATRASYAACGNEAVRSTSAAYGAILFSATARTASRRASWSSGTWNRSKSVFGFMMGALSVAGVARAHRLAVVVLERVSWVAVWSGSR